MADLCSTTLAYAILLWTSTTPVASDMAPQGVTMRQDICWVKDNTLQVVTQYYIFDKEVGTPKKEPVCIVKDPKTGSKDPKVGFECWGYDPEGQ